MWALLFVALFIFTASSQAQSFETASIKASTTGGKMGVGSIPERFTIQSADLRGLIQMAYGVRDFQIAGGPAWMDSDHYDIDAKARGNPTPVEWLRTMGPMLQGLLREKFGLRIHRAMQELPVYELTVSKDRPGTAIRKSAEGSCPTFEWHRSSPPPGQGISVHCGALELTNISLNHTLVADGMNLRGVPGNPFAPSLATFLSRQLDHLVIDKTGLTGLFDFHLEWNRLATDRLLGRSVPDDADDGGPSLFTAVQEQLGLKLERRKAPVEVLVVDQARKPSEN